MSVEKLLTFRERQWCSSGARQKVNMRMRIGPSASANCPVNHLWLPRHCLDGQGLNRAINRARQTVMGTEDNYDASAARVQVCAVVSPWISASVKIKSKRALANPQAWVQVRAHICTVINLNWWIEQQCQRSYMRSKTTLITTKDLCWHLIDLLHSSLLKKYTRGTVLLHHSFSKLMGNNNIMFKNNNGRTGRRRLV